LSTLSFSSIGISKRNDLQVFTALHGMQTQSSGEVGNIYINLGQIYSDTTYQILSELSKFCRRSVKKILAWTWCIWAAEWQLLCDDFW